MTHARAEHTISRAGDLPKAALMLMATCAFIAQGCESSVGTCQGSTCQSDSCGNGSVDAGEQCDGGDCCSSTCEFLGSETECRATAGACDLAEVCSGSAAACPADDLAPAATVCRALADACDLAEACTGADPTCPSDGKKGDGTACEGGTCQAGVCFAPSDRTLIIPSVSAPGGGEVLVRVDLSDGATLGLVSFVLHYDPAVLSVKDRDLDGDLNEEVLEGPLLVNRNTFGANANVPGQINFLFVTNGEPITSGWGTVMEVTMSVSATAPLGSSPLTLSDAELAVATTSALVDIALAPGTMTVLP